MCENMNELEMIVSEILEKRAEKATIEKDIEELEKSVKQYMTKRQKEEISTKSAKVLYKGIARQTFDKDAFLENEKNGEKLFNKYQKVTSYKSLKISNLKVAN